MGLGRLGLTASRVTESERPTSPHELAAAPRRQCPDQAQGSAAAKRPRRPQDAAEPAPVAGMRALLYRNASPPAAASELTFRIAQQQIGFCLDAASLDDATRRGGLAIVPSFSFHGPLHVRLAGSIGEGFYLEARALTAEGAREVLGQRLLRGRPALERLPRMAAAPPTSVPAARMDLNVNRKNYIGTTLEESMAMGHCASCKPDASSPFARTYRIENAGELTVCAQPGGGGRGGGGGGGGAAPEVLFEGRESLRVYVKEDSLQNISLSDGALFSMGGGDSARVISSRTFRVHVRDHSAAVLAGVLVEKLTIDCPRQGVVLCEAVTASTACRILCGAGSSVARPASILSLDRYRRDGGSIECAYMPHTTVKDYEYDGTAPAAHAARAWVLARQIRSFGPRAARELRDATDAAAAAAAASRSASVRTPDPPRSTRARDTRHAPSVDPYPFDGSALFDAVDMDLVEQFDYERAADEHRLADGVFARGHQGESPVRARRMSVRPHPFFVPVVSHPRGSADFGPLSSYDEEALMALAQTLSFGDWQLAGDSTLKLDPATFERPPCGAALEPGQHCDATCLFCTDAPACVVAMPCKHAVGCAACANKMVEMRMPNRCPLCRSAMERMALIGDGAVDP